MKPSLLRMALTSSGRTKRIRLRISWYGPSNPISKSLITAEGGTIFVGRHEVKNLVLKIDYHVPEKTRGGWKRSQSAVTYQVEITYCFDHIHKLQLVGNYCNLVAKYQSEVRYARKRGKTLQVTCGPHGPVPADVISRRSPFASTKEQYAGFWLVFEGRSNTFMLLSTRLNLEQSFPTVKTNNRIIIRTSQWIIT